MPGLDASLVVAGLVANRSWNLDDPVGLVLDEALADGFPKLGEILFRLALVEKEEHVDRVERFDGLHRYVVGVAGPYTDEKNLLHADASPIANATETVNFALCRWGTPERLHQSRFG